MAYYSSFSPITACATCVLSKPRNISHVYKTRASDTRKTPRRKFPNILGFLKKQFCSKRFRYLGSENVRKIFYLHIIPGFSAQEFDKEKNFRTSVSPMLFSTTEKRYEQVDNNRFCTWSICSSQLWFVKSVKYNSHFCDENTNFKYALETDEKKKCKFT